MKSSLMTHTAGSVCASLSRADFDASCFDVETPELPGADGKRMIRLLVFTSLYPNAAQPRHGVFVEERLRYLVATGGISATVVAPVPWFPFRHPRFGTYAAFANAPEVEQRYGIRILHPRYPVIPKLGMSLAPFLMYRALLPAVRRLLGKDSAYDLVDAHYFYPDGAVAVKLGAAINKPVVITARGNDVTLIPRYRIPKWQILRTAKRADAIVTVSQALRERLIGLGVTAERIKVLRNGVDLERFRPLEAGALRGKFGLNGPMWLAVGHLIERKGVHIVIGALLQVPGVTLLIAGDGPEERYLRNLAARLGVAERVRFLGAIRHTQLCEYYSAADVTVLASSREGMPNVVLESLACGTPVIAAPFDGVRELLSTPEAGEIAESRTSTDVATAWMRLRSRLLERGATRRFAELRLSWGPVAEAQRALYAQVLANFANRAKSGTRS